VSKLVSVGEARARIAADAPDPGEEIVDLSSALGRQLSQDVAARLFAPFADVSAMDGYAVRFRDVAEGAVPLKVTGEIPAGKVAPGPIGPGEAMRIFTGAPLPPGADHILIQEDADRNGDLIRVSRAQDAPRYVRQRGRDFAEGEVILAAGTALGPADLALAAASNHAALPVRRRLRVAIITAGDELRPAGSPLAPGQIVESVSPALEALAKVWGADVIRVPIVPDSVAAIRAALEAAPSADVIVGVGGASVGDYDFTRKAFQESGAETVFAGVAVRPGKPTWFARLGQQRVLGLPGNPASAYVCAHLFLKPLLAGETGRLDFFKARLDAPVEAEGNRESYLRAFFTADLDGLRVRLFADQDSSLLRPLTMANCLVRRLRGSPALEAGDVVECLPLTQTSSASPSSIRLSPETG
jgi:molybdopterin molybdotransferase